MGVNPRRTALHDRPSRGGRPAFLAVVAAALVATAVGLAGCTPGPTPKPTPTPLFTSEADAFKAAEQVYRDYVDATNAKNDGDNDVDPTMFLSGAALEHAIELTRKREQAGLSISGHSVMVSFRGMETNLEPPTTTVTAQVCVDGSATRILDAAGKDVTPSDRAPRGLLKVVFSGSKETLRISSSKVVSSTC